MSPIVSGGGGGGSSRPSLPIADQSGAAVIDTTTYNDSVKGGGKLTTLVLPPSTAGFAIARESDAFPRFIWANDALYVGNGTVDPYTNGAYMDANGVGGIGWSGVNAGNLTLGGTSEPNRGAGGVHAYSPGFIVLSGAGATNTAIRSGYGDPNGSVGAELTDVYFRSDAPDVNHFIYRCTTAGDAATAVWTAIGGLT